MTETQLDRAAKGALVAILPVALGLGIVLTAWPLLLPALGVGLVLRVWQHYRWKRWSQQVQPFFEQLLRENHGRIAPLDLALKANLTGEAARRFLARRAEEYGAQRQASEAGTFYYFLTASALGSLFADSEPESAADEVAASAPELAQGSRHPQASAESATQEPTPAAPEADAPPEAAPSSGDRHAALLAALNTTPNPDGGRDTSETDGAATQPLGKDWTLNQAELARRLDVHASTVGKRKADPDFAEWSQTRDPDGIAWIYQAQNKAFIPADA